MILGSFTLFSYHRQRRDDLHNKLFDLLGDRLNIRSYVYDQLPPDHSYTDDLVVITTPFFKERVIASLHPDTPYIVAKRTVRMDKLGCLFTIPPGSHVLVVYSLYAGAMDLAKNIREMGFTHFYMHGFDRNKPLERDYQYAITLSEPHMVPAGIPHILDLGMRDLSLSTIGQILSFFTGNNEIDDLVMNRYIRQIIDNMGLLDQEIRKNARMQRNLQLLLDEFEEGLIYFDRDGHTLECNQLARTYLGGYVDQTVLAGLLPEAWPQNKNSSYAYDLALDDKFYRITLRILHAIDQELWMLSLRPQNQAAQPIPNTPMVETDQAGGNSHFASLVHRSATIGQLIARAARMAHSETTILILGESGTGKELLARAIHDSSRRAAGPFLPVNCGALTESLLESELFGYEEGAFTGARKRGKQGLFELACGGTIFLDEIGDASLVVQQRLLRVLQEKEVYRISGERPIPVDVRIIAATHRDLPALIRSGKFRQDLYYRINILPITLPPLRSRQEDILPIFHHYLALLLADPTCTIPELRERALTALLNYPWPGNIRELRNLTEYLANGILYDPNFVMEEEILTWLKEQSGLQDESADGTKTTGLGGSSRVLPAATGTVGHPLPQPSPAQPPLSRESLVLLLALHLLQQDGRPPGHGAILTYSKEQGINLTSWQLKTRLKRLQTLGLVHSRKGAGSRLTPSGLACLPISP